MSSIAIGCVGVATQLGVIITGSRLTRTVAMRRPLMRSAVNSKVPKVTVSPTAIAS